MARTATGKRQSGKSRAAKAAEIARELQRDRVEDMLVQGVPVATVIKALRADPPQGYSMSTVAANKLITEVHERWQKARDKEAPHRREKVWRMAEVLYAKSVNKSPSVAASLLSTMNKMLPAPVDEAEVIERRRIVEQLGPAPQDPVQLSLWAQRAMVLELIAILGDASLEPERRVQFIALFGSRIAALHPQALAGRRMEELETQVAQLAPRDERAMVDGETEEALQAFAERLRASIAVEPPTEH